MEHVGLEDEYWESLVIFVKNHMLPKYQQLLTGDMTEEATHGTTEERFLIAIEKLFNAVTKDPVTVYKNSIKNKVFN